MKARRLVCGQVKTNSHSEDAILDRCNVDKRLNCIQICASSETTKKHQCGQVKT